jgi:hypothetical protein
MRCKNPRDASSNDAGQRRSGLQVDLQVYISQCLLVKELVNTAKANYYSSLIEEAGSDNKKLYQTIDLFSP